MQPPESSLAEFTWKAVVTGVLLGLLFGAANAYIGLRVGLTFSASIPAAVMTVAVFRLVARRSTLLEANLSQTIASASTSLASGTIFTIPALFMWGVAPSYLQMVVLAFLGALLGLSAMIPLRRLLIVQEHASLPYPEGTACAEVLRSTMGSARGGGWIFLGMGLGFGIKLLLSAGFLVPSHLSFAVPELPKALVGLEMAPALIGIGFILGPRQGGVMGAGAVIAALVLVPLIAWFGAGLSTPLFPETKKLVADMSTGEILKQYVRFLGAGAVAMAGILTVLKTLPSMVAAVRGVVHGLRGGVRSGSGERTDRDLPGAFVVAGTLTVVLVAALVPGVLAGDMPLAARLVCGAGIGLFGLLFVTVAARIVGIVGVSTQPTSGMTLVTILGTASAFALAGWKDESARAAVLTVGTIVAIAASKAGDISQDLKTGWLVGATPARQQFGQLIGAACACWGVAAAVLLLAQEYGFGGEGGLSAPQATLMKTITEGVLAGDLPWGLVGTGAALALAVALCGVSGLTFAIGVYLPPATTFSIWLGALLRGLLERKPSSPTTHSKSGDDPAILAASGVIAGEGLAGVLIAALVWQKVIPKESDALLHGTLGELVTGLLFLAVAACLLLAKRSRRAA